MLLIVAIGVLQVAEPVRIVAFSADLRWIVSGERVHLRWKVDGAEGRRETAAVCSSTLQIQTRFYCRI